LFQSLLKRLYESEYLCVIQPLFKSYQQLKKAREGIYPCFIVRPAFDGVRQQSDASSVASATQDSEAAIIQAAQQQPQAWRFLVSALDDTERVVV
jgi:hypothetical protein